MGNCHLKLWVNKRPLIIANYNSMHVRVGVSWTQDKYICLVPVKGVYIYLRCNAISWSNGLPIFHSLMGLHMQESLALISLWVKWAPMRWNSNNLLCQDIGQWHNCNGYWSSCQYKFLIKRLEKSWERRMQKVLLYSYHGPHPWH